MKKLVIANWKMNPGSLKEAESLWGAVAKGAAAAKNAEVVICPPFPFISISRNLKLKQKSKKIILGAQDVSANTAGPHTGSVSASMLASAGVKYVIVGHSDMRNAGDTNATINQKITNILKNKMQPVLCIGESDRDEGGEYLKFIKAQIHECLAGIPAVQMKNVVIAYEPIWSISTNPNATEDTPEDSLEMSIFIRKVLSDMFSATTAQQIRIIYGGSVHEKNAEGFFVRGGVAGVLVGRASLDAKKFIKIINSACK